MYELGIRTLFFVCGIECIYKLPAAATGLTDEEGQKKTMTFFTKEQRNAFEMIWTPGLPLAKLLKTLWIGEEFVGM